MEKRRIFSQTELKELGRKTRDLVDEAIDEGELEKAKRLNHRMYIEFLGMHDLYVNWVTSLMSYIYDHYADEILHQALKQSCTSYWRPIFERYEKEKDFHKKVEMFALGLRGHLQELKIEEDDEKVTFSGLPCGSGERLIQEGAYDGPPKHFSTVKKPQPRTYGKADMPIYCTHEPMIEILPIEWSGYPLVVCYCPQDMRGGGCRFCLYKDPDAIPAEVYTRLGKTKISIKD